MTDASKKVVWRWEGDTFGFVSPDEDPDGNGVFHSLDLAFPGQLADRDDTGLFYNINRYYDPVTGRYTQSDPIGLVGGVDLYAYVGGSPVSRVDPIGLWSISGAFYRGWGGGFVFGRDNCGRFFTFRIGAGAGGGVSYALDGVRPGYEETCECEGSEAESGGMSGGLYGELSGAIPWITATKGVEVGAKNNNDGSSYFYGGVTGGGAVPGSGGGLRLEGAAGAEFTFYSRKM